MQDEIHFWTGIKSAQSSQNPIIIITTYALKVFTTNGGVIQPFLNLTN